MSNNLRANGGGKRAHRRSSYCNSHAVTKVFVAMSFRDTEEPALVDYWHAMERAAMRAHGDFELRRIDKVAGDYEIIDRIAKEINAADLVIADLTLSSPT
jgi:hypothetical protein